LRDEVSTGSGSDRVTNWVSSHVSRTPNRVGFTAGLKGVNL